VGPRTTAGANANGWMQQSFGANGAKATFSIPGDAIPHFGFVPIRVSIENTEPRDLRWQAEFALNSYSGFGNTTAESTVTLTAPANRSGDRWIFVPTADSGVTRNYGGYIPTYGGLAVNVTGTGLPASRLVFNGGGGAVRSRQMAPWAVSAALEVPVRARIAGLTTAAPVPGPGLRRRIPAATGPQPLVSGAPNLTSFDLAQPYGDWRIFAPFTRFVMGADEYAVLLPATKGALRNWVAQGGWLYLAPQNSQPKGEEIFGAGRIVMLSRPIKDETDDASSLFTPAGVFELTPVVPNIGDLTLQSGALPGKIPGEKRVGDWLIYFFIGFAALVAPINLLVIAPVRRRHWLFFSLPAISVGAVAVLVAAIFLQDGVAGEGARRAFVVLLPGENEAAIFQDQISRTGLLFNTAFALPEDAVCANVPASDSNFQPGRALQYDRQDGRASGDWFRGRARQAQHLRRIVATRGRLERVGQAPDGAPIVQSTIGARLRDLIYVDAAGGSWSAPDVPVGARVTLRRLDGNGDYGRRVADFASEASVHFAQLVRGAALVPTVNRFVAFAEPSELAPIPTLANIAWKDSAVLMTGVVAGATGGTSTP
jgi:hypothetical protein